MNDLDAQQKKLSSISYDLRITNLARFIFKKITRNDSRYTFRERRPSLLDVGAGNGLFLKFFQAQGFRVAGYDLEKENVANMKKDPDLAGISIRQGDITKLKGISDYDIVIASDVIEHIKDDSLAIGNLWSFVKPGGVLIITVPGHSYLYGKRDKKWGHFRRYDQSMLHTRVEKVLEGEYEILFSTQWNVVGFFAYFLFEKILHRPINERMRHSDSFFARITRFGLDLILKGETLLGGLPLGLTMVIGIRKKL